MSGDSSLFPVSSQMGLTAGNIGGLRDLSWPALQSLYQDYAIMAYSLGRANAQLELRQARTQMNQNPDAAYADTFAMCGGGMYVLSSRGQRLRLASFTFDHVLRISSDPELGWEEAILIVFAEKSIAPLTMTWKTYQSDKQFLSELRCHTGGNIYAGKSASFVARLLRNELEKRAVHMFIPLYGGWKRADDAVKRFVFYRFYSKFTSHQPGCDPSYSAGYPENWMDNARMAMETMLDGLDFLTDPNHKGLVFLIRNLGFFFSLLEMVGHPFQIAFNLLVSDAVTEAYLEKCLPIYGDGSISLDLDPEIFSYGLYHAKDEPIVVMGPPDCLRENLGTLINSVSSSSIRNGKRLRALPVVVSRQVLQMTADKNFLTIDSMQVTYCESALDFLVGEGHWMCLAPYTAERTTRLVDLIERGKVDARRKCPAFFSTRQINAVGILSGVKEFLADFLCKLGLQDRVTEVFPEGIIPWIVGVIEDRVCETGDYPWHVRSFIAVVRKMVAAGELNGVSVVDGRAAFKGTDQEILFSETAFLFPSRTMMNICSRLSFGKNVLIRALASENMLGGTPVNEGTKETRWLIYLENGRKKHQCGFELSRSLFESQFDYLF